MSSLKPSTPATPVEYPTLGASGLKVSRLWLGAMMFGDRTDDTEAGRIIDAAREAGVNAIDTANMYAEGRSEAMVGRWVNGDRERWIIATKLANPTGPGPNDRGTSRRHMMSAVPASLKRLGMDHIDLLYLHRDDDATPMEETLAALATLIERGWIHHWGVSNFRAWRVASITETARRMGVPGPVACQPVYNAMTRGIETELLPCCAHYGLGVVAYSPMARGVLSGKYRPGEAAPEGTRAARQDRRILQTEFRAESLLAAQRLAARAAERGMAPGQFALQWAWHNRLVHGLIGGPRTLAQWQDYLDALRDMRFAPEDEAFVDALVPPGHASTPGWTDPIYPVTGRVPRTAAP